MKYFYHSYIVLLFFITINFLCLGQDSISVYQPTGFDKFIERLNYSKKVKNQNIIGISYGYSNLSYPHRDIISELTPVFLTEINYGFIRFEDNYKESEFIHFASETAFLANYSSHMTFEDWKGKAKTTDCWRFGFVFTNGYGYDLNTSGKLLLYHSGDLSWSKIDFENPGESVTEQTRYNVFDTEFKFGTSYGTGIKYYYYDGFAVDAGYEHSLVFPKHLVLKWMGTAFTELLAQRTIDYFGEDYLQNSKYFPAHNFILKNFISLAFYELRRKQMNWFFPSEPPINYDSFKIGLSYTF